MYIVWLHIPCVCVLFVWWTVSCACICEMCGVIVPCTSHTTLGAHAVCAHVAVCVDGASVGGSTGGWAGYHSHGQHHSGGTWNPSVILHDSMIPILSVFSRN